MKSRLFTFIFFLLLISLAHGLSTGYAPYEVKCPNYDLLRVANVRLELILILYFWW